MNEQLLWKWQPDCSLCGERFDITDRDPMHARSRDHIIPKSWGAPWASWNLRAAHRWCNSMRGAVVGGPEFHSLVSGLLWIRPPGRAPVDHAETLARWLIDDFRSHRTRYGVSAYHVRGTRLVLHVQRGHDPWTWTPFDEPTTGTGVDRTRAVDEPTPWQPPNWML